ncbi:hypothetical protein A2U01_0074132, partial [Trifolium medium]|nr:hypothetical protein [Trifolium medium]
MGIAAAEDSLEVFGVVRSWDFE